jgi:hypothetical protein
MHREIDKPIKPFDVTSNKPLYPENILLFIIHSPDSVFSLEPLGSSVNDIFFPEI